MKNSTLVRQRHNYKIIDMFKLLKRIRHSTREEYSKNIEAAKTYLNQNFILDYENKKIKSTKMNGKELTKFLENQINFFIDKFKNNTTHTEEEKKYFQKLKEQKQTTKRRLKGKGLNLEEFEKLNISREDYINQYYKKEYKSESMTLRFKNKTLESLKTYIELRDNKPQVKKHLRNKNTRVQEQIIKIPIENKTDFTEEDLKEILKNKIQIEKQKGNMILYSSFHLDESSNHIHLFIIDENFNILRNNINYINKKYNKNYVYENMTEKELIELGEILTKEDYDLCNSIMNKKGVEFKLRHEVHKNLTNEERKLKNKKIKSKKSNIQNDLYNNLNLKLEKIEKSLKYHSNLSKNIIKKFREYIDLIEERKNTKQQYKLKRELEAEINKIKSTKQQKELKEVFNQISPTFSM